MAKKKSPYKKKKVSDCGCMKKKPKTTKRRK